MRGLRRVRSLPKLETTAGGGADDRVTAVSSSGNYRTLHSTRFHEQIVTSLGLGAVMRLEPGMRADCVRRLQD